MKKIYEKIWELAKPYYLKGRPMDIDHIEWMMKAAKMVCEKEKIDDTLLMPLVILHDVGYANVPKDNPFNLDLRKMHMEEGAKIAKAILESVNYEKEKTETISYYISIHDNWALGDNDKYKNDIILGIFNDFDYMWMAEDKGFPLFLEILKKSISEMIEFLNSNEKLINRPFCTETTREMYETYINARNDDLSTNNKQQ